MVEKAPDGSRHDGEEAPSVGEVILPAARESFSKEGIRSFYTPFHLITRSNGSHREECCLSED